MATPFAYSKWPSKTLEPASVQLPCNSRATPCNPHACQRATPMLIGGCTHARLMHAPSAVDRAACEEALQRARNFTEAQLDDAKLVEAELSEVLGLWFERWLRLGHE
jgi:hypothetical protein